MNVELLQQTWALPGPRRVTPLAQGTNNVVQRVETPAGDYVLRLYGNHADPGRLRFEHQVLALLDALRLPFALPLPLPAVTGERAALLSDEQGDTLATLTPFIAGDAPQRDDLPQAEAAGEALGILDVALAQVEASDALASSATYSWRSYGDLEHCHPLVPDPLAALQTLPVDEEVRRRLVARYRWLMEEQIPALYASLPQQLAHEDYGPDNILMKGTSVTGVLDFEFCAHDLRAMDLLVALSWWPVEQFGSGAEWPIIEAFTRGYARRVTLTGPEIEAMPTLYILRAYTSLIHRLGRQRQGLSSEQAVTARATAALEREDWLEAHGEQWLQLLRTIFAS